MVILILFLTLCFIISYAFCIMLVISLTEHSLL